MLIHITPGNLLRISWSACKITLFMKALTLIFVIFLMYTCNKPTGTDKNSNVNTDLDIVQDTISIPVSVKHLQSYYGACSYIKDESLYLVGYNQHYHSFDFFNISKNKHARTLKLASQGPEKTPRMHNFAVHNDTIIHLSKTKDCVYLIEAKTGNLIGKYIFTDIVKKSGYLIGKRGLTLGRSNNLAYSKERNSILFHSKSELQFR
mgnify:CR=1 FL=1